MSVIPEGYAQVNWFFEGLGAPLGAECTLGLEVAGLLDPSEVAELAHGVWVANILGFQSDQISLVRCLAKFGPNDTGPDGEFIFSSVGGDAGDSGSPAVAFLVKKNTVVGGRRGRGRMFLPGAAESRVEPDGAVSSAVVTGLTDGLAAFYDDFTEADLLPVVLHGEGSPIGPSTITSFSVDPKVATQRRRLR